MDKLCSCLYSNANLGSPRLFLQEGLHVASENLPPIGSDWYIKMPAVNGWAGQAEAGLENFLGLGQKEVEGEGDQPSRER